LADSPPDRRCVPCPLEQLGGFDPDGETGEIGEMVSLMTTRLRLTRVLVDMALEVCPGS
jgi:hypothetical protein